MDSSSRISQILDGRLLTIRMLYSRAPKLVWSAHAQKDDHLYRGSPPPRGVRVQPVRGTPQLVGVIDLAYRYLPRYSTRAAICTLDAIPTSKNAIAQRT